MDEESKKTETAQSRIPPWPSTAHPLGSWIARGDLERRRAADPSTATTDSPAQILARETPSPSQNLRAAQNRLLRDCLALDSLLAQLFRHQSKRHTRQKNEERRGQRPAQLRPPSQ